MKKAIKKMKTSAIGALAISEYERYKERNNFQRYSDYEYIMQTYGKLGRTLDLVNPKRYTEKLQWLKLFWRSELAPIVSNKYEVRKYLMQCGHGDLLNELYTTFTSIDDFEISKLPEQFVLKGTHGSGFNLIVKDKNSLNWSLWKKVMKSWLRRNYYWCGREWNYDIQTPSIVIERYLEDDSGELRDFKIICLNGKAAFMQIDENRSTNHKRMFVDKDGVPIGMDDGIESSNMGVTFDTNQRKMIDLAEELAKPFPNVRIDFYDCNGKIYFGEFTFFGGSGFYNFTPDEWDYTWGEKLLLPEVNFNHDLYQRILKGEVK